MSNDSFLVGNENEKVCETSRGFPGRSWLTTLRSITMGNPLERYIPKLGRMLRKRHRFTFIENLVATIKINTNQLLVWCLVVICTRKWLRSIHLFIFLFYIIHITLKLTGKKRSPHGLVNRPLCGEECVQMNVFLLNKCKKDENKTVSNNILTFSI